MDDTTAAATTETPPEDSPLYTRAFNASQQFVFAPTGAQDALLAPCIEARAQLVEHEGEEARARLDSALCEMSQARMRQARDTYFAEHPPATEENA